MALHSGIDTVAFISDGVYSETYGSATLKNLCNLFAFYGLEEDAISTAIKIVNIMEFYKRIRSIS